MIVQNEAAALEPVALETGGTFTLGYKEAPALAPRIVADLESAVLARRRGAGRQGREGARRRREDEKPEPPGARAAHRRREDARGARRGPRPLEPVPARAGRRGCPSRSTASKAERKKGKTTVTLTLSVPVARLARTPSARGESGAFSVFVASAAADGSFSDVVRQRQPFEIPGGDAEKADAGHFTYELPVVVAVGRGADLRRRLGRGRAGRRLPRRRGPGRKGDAAPIIAACPPASRASPSSARSRRGGAGSRTRTRASSPRCAGSASTRSSSASRGCTRSSCIRGRRIIRRREGEEEEFS